MTSYKGTVTREQLTDLLVMLFPKMPGKCLDEVLSKGLTPPRYRVPTDDDLARTSSKLEVSLYPYAPDPILVVKDEYGRVRGLEFHLASKSNAVYEIFEVCPEGVDLLNNMEEETR